MDIVIPKCELGPEFLSSAESLFLIMLPHGPTGYYKKQLLKEGDLCICTLHILVTKIKVAPPLNFLPKL